MEWLPYLLPLAFLCFLASFAIQACSPYSWYAGWVFLFFAASAFGTVSLFWIVDSQNSMQTAFALTFLLGGVTFWVGGAVWWATNRNMFFPAPPRSRTSTSPPSGSPPPAA
jgi:hypothetical protein